MSTKITSPWSPIRQFTVAIGDMIGVEQNKLTASDGNTYDYFGRSIDVSLDGNTCVVGAPGDGSGAGSAYIFVRNGLMWDQQAKIVPSDQNTVNVFGSSVSITDDGAAVIVGAPGNLNKGAAYIFTRNGTTWTQKSKLTASDGAANDRFGESVAISGDGTTSIVSSPQDDDKGIDSGSAYIFITSGSSWSQQAKIQASDGTAGDFFGYSVDMNLAGTYCVIGAIYENAVYVFSRSGSTWTQQAKITGSDSAVNDYFGYDVSINASGDKLVVSATGDDDQGSASGSVYVFGRSGTAWTQEAKVLGNNLVANDKFGSSVDIDAAGSLIVIGTESDGDKGVDAGSAYVFMKNNGSWIQKAKFLAADGFSGDQFGKSVSVSGDKTTFVIGSHFADAKGVDSGAAYIFV